MSENQLSFYVDGKLIVGNENENLFEAIKNSGFSMPGFCFHPLFESTRKCLLCNVFDEKKTEVISSCLTKPEEGGRYSLYHEELSLSKSEVDSLYQGAHNFSCSQCNHRSRCHLVDEVGNKSVSLEKAPDKGETIELSEDLSLNLDQCISCMLCTDFEESVSTVPALSNEGEVVLVVGKLTHNYGVNLLDICPTGCFESGLVSNIQTNVLEADFCRGCDRLCRTEVHYNHSANGLRPIRASSPRRSSFWVCDEVNKPLKYTFKLPLRSLLSKVEGRWLVGDHLSLSENWHFILPDNLPEELWDNLISEVSSLTNREDWSYEFIRWPERSTQAGILRSQTIFTQKKKEKVEQLIGEYNGDLGHKKVLLVMPEWIADDTSWKAVMERFNGAKFKAFAGPFMNHEIYDKADSLLPLPPYWEMSWNGTNYQNEEVAISREAPTFKIFKGEKSDS